MAHSRKSEPNATSTVPSGKSASLYDRGYFHGETSGYPTEGYSQLRDAWKAWLSLLTEIKPPPGNLVDLGGAYLRFRDQPGLARLSVLLACLLAALFIDWVGAYMALGIEAFILSGYPHEEECELFARYVLPELDHAILR